MLEQTVKSALEAPFADEMLNRLSVALQDILIEFLLAVEKYVGVSMLGCIPGPSDGSSSVKTDSVFCCKQITAQVLPFSFN